ncbi:DUF4870 domain-containing protein [Halorussus amylolyticus]|uniref:DUF4870 domain-containing protein n=1 Tax=Halorussus amylolyticus TaxID=1126242 RepID=UPI0010447757|nr:DUF4870 domain-containing protein [Halorussus amylolyticus]
MSTATTAPDSHQRTLAGIVVHPLAFLFGIFGAGIMYLLSDGGFSKSNARHALNWQLFFLISVVALGAVFFTINSDLIGVMTGFLIMGLFFADFAFCLWATVKAIGSESWAYPFSPDIV